MEFVCAARAQHGLENTALPHTTQHLQANGPPKGVAALAALYKRDLRLLQLQFSGQGLAHCALVAGVEASKKDGLMAWLLVASVSTQIARCFVCLHCHC